VAAPAGAALFAFTFVVAKSIFFEAFAGEAMLFEAPFRFSTLGTLVLDAVAAFFAGFTISACSLAVFDAAALASVRAAFFAAALCRAQRKRCAAAIRSVASGLTATAA
jgi:hypothetical protein